MRVNGVLTCLKNFFAILTKSEMLRVALKVLPKLSKTSIKYSYRSFLYLGQP